MKATRIFVILLSQDGFESNCPETKFQTILSQSQFRSSRTQMFFKISVSQKFRNRRIPALESLFKNVAGPKVCKFMEKRLQHLRCLFLSIWQGNFSVLGICRPSTSQSKTIWDGFYQKGLQIFSWVCSLHIISRNHCNIFLLINLHKTKTFPNKSMQQELFVLISDFDNFNRLLFIT